MLVFCQLLRRQKVIDEPIEAMRSFSRPTTNHDRLCPLLPEVVTVDGVGFKKAMDRISAGDILPDSELVVDIIGGIRVDGIFFSGGGDIFRGNGDAWRLLRGLSYRCTGDKRFFRCVVGEWELMMRWMRWVCHYTLRRSETTE